MPDHAEREKLVMALVESALKRPREERDTFLRSACGADDSLYEEVRHRIEEEEQTDPFFGEPFPSVREIIDRPFEPGQSIAGRFRIVRQVGRGGMGIVYEAIDEKLDRRIAIKCARIGYGGQLPPEARAASEVSHFNICRIHELHTVQTPAGEVEFITMEFIDGETVAARLRTSGPMGDRELREIILQVASGLAEAHRHGIIHGDLKPGNVIVTRSPEGGVRAVLNDFGLAKLSAGSSSRIGSGRGGTFEYMSPELFRGERPTIASDIYALGIMIHEMCTGLLPKRSSPDARAFKPGDAQRECELKPLPSPWAEIVRRCVAPNPRDRFQSASQIIEELRPRRAWAKWIGLGAATACAVIAYGVWRFQPQTGPPVRLAVLPISLEGAPAPALHGLGYDVANRLKGLRRGFFTLSPEDAQDRNVDSSEKAAKLLNATHVLQTRVEHRGSQLVAHASLLDAATGQSIRELQGTYSDADSSTLAKALIATVTRGLGLRAVVKEEVAPRAYGEYVRGVALLRRDNDSGLEAADAFSRALQLDPKSALAAAGLAEAQMMLYRRTGEEVWMQRGLATADEAKSLNPDSGPVLLVEGWLKFEGGHYEQAAQDFTRATQLEPNDAESWYDLALANGKLNRPAEAVAAFHHAIEAQPNYFRPHLDLFGFHLFRGEYQEAEAVIRHLTAIAPNLNVAHTDLGLVLADLGRFAEAQSEIQRSLAIEKSDIARFALGYVYYEQRKFSEAASEFETIAAGQNPIAAYFQDLGIVYDFLGRHSDAQRAYREGLRLAEASIVKNPRNAIERARLAVLAAHLGDRGRAEYEVAQAVQMAPENVKLMRLAAEAYETLSEREQTLATLQRVPAATIAEISRSPEYHDLQRDSRFLALLGRNQSR